MTFKNELAHDLFFVVALVSGIFLAKLMPDTESVILLVCLILACGGVAITDYQR